MDDSWRFRSMHGDVCPICYTKHFPFCTPPPAFDRSRFAGEFAPPFQYDPRPALPLYHRQVPPPPFRGPDPWSGIRPGFPPPHRFHQEEFLERENFNKRMRIDETALGNFPPARPSYDRFLSEDERRLSLIRDHGQQSTAEGMAQLNADYRMDRFPNGDLGVGYVGGNDPTLPLEPTFGYQNQHTQGNMYQHYGNFVGDRNPHSISRFPSQESKDFERDRAFNHEVRKIGGVSYEISDLGRNGANARLTADNPVSQNNQPNAPSQITQSYEPGYSGLISQKYPFRASDETSMYECRPHATYPNPDNASQGPHRMYHGNDHQRFPPTENSPCVLPEQTPYAETDRDRMAQYLVKDEERSSHPAYMVRNHADNKSELYSQHSKVTPTSFEVKHLTHEGTMKPFESQSYPATEQYSAKVGSEQRSFPHLPGRSYVDHIATEGRVQGNTPRSYPSMPPPIPAVYPEASSSATMVNSTLFPVLASASATKTVPPNSRTLPEIRPPSQANRYNVPPASEFTTEGLPFVYQAPLERHIGGKAYPSTHGLSDKATVVSACHLFKQPHRASRPDHIVIILRGLPGSGKSYLAKALRDLEVENGGSAPRIHAMDDYFMIEVEKDVEDNEGSKSSSSFKGKKQLTKKVIEYCYESEMEEAYRSSMLRAFKKTLDEGIFTFVIVDDRNLRVADFAQFWAIAKRSGYEVYLLEAPYKDPTGCAARNVHRFTLDDIQKMADKWEEAPSLYLRLDIQSLFKGDDLNEHSIQEVDMDTDDADCAGSTHNLLDKEDVEQEKPKSSDLEANSGLSKAGDRWDSEEEEEVTAVKELGKSKWSKDLDEDAEDSYGKERNSGALFGLVQAYGKSRKSVHWGDKDERRGFSIGAAKKRTTSSLIIGPGSGYNLESNPLIEDDTTSKGRSNTESKKRFSEQLRAERESFKAVFDRRRQRIGGLNYNEDD
ncbi:uncharacterized protein [Typha angustifolia]|uniref:uncharacterized protein n=1 Tax=Typha angustifolia TaxID=59011 RepID=UPI003C2C076D